MWETIRGEVTMRLLSWSACVTFVAGLLTVPTWSAGQEPKKPEKAPAIRLGEPLEVGPKDSPLQKALKERYNEALAEVRVRRLELMAGRKLLDEIFDAFQRAVYAGLEAMETPAARVALLKQYLDLAREVEDIVATKVKAGTVSQAELHRARYIRHDAEVRLLRAQAKVKGGKGN
jgi:hypothetical protein